MTIADSRVVAWHTDDFATDKSATTYDKVVAARWVSKGWPVTPLVHESLLAEAESRIVVLQSRLDAVVGLVGELVTLAKAHEIKADRADTHPDTSNWHGGYDEGVTECVERIRAALGCATAGEGG